LLANKSRLKYGGKSLAELVKYPKDCSSKKKRKKRKNIVEIPKLMLNQPAKEQIQSKKPLEDEPNEEQKLEKKKK